MLQNSDIKCWLLHYLVFSLYASLPIWLVEEKFQRIKPALTKSQHSQEASSWATDTKGDLEGKGLFGI